MNAAVLGEAASSPGSAMRRTVRAVNRMSYQRPASRAPRPHILAQRSCMPNPDGLQRSASNMPRCVFRRESSQLLVGLSRMVVQGAKDGLTLDLPCDRWTEAGRLSFYVLRDAVYLQAIAPTCRNVVSGVLHSKDGPRLGCQTYCNTV